MMSIPARRQWLHLGRGSRSAGLLGALLLLGFLAPSVADAQERRVVTSLLEMRRDKVLVQRWDLSCGAAVLATLLTYQLLDPHSERDVALALVSREEYLENPDLLQFRQGFSLLDMKRYVERRGYKGVGYGKMTYADLLEKAPVVVPINTNGYNHFVVFRGSYGDRVLLADPAWGNRTMIRQDFLASWIDYGEKIGHVGFVVLYADGTQPPNNLAPSPRDFVLLR